MILQTATKGVYIAHFHHSTSTASAPAKMSSWNPPSHVLWDRVTTCSVHAGPCKTTLRPCPDASRVGVALCSKRDNFEKHRGRKLAFTRAINALPKDVRAELWAVYPNKEGA